VKARFDLLLSYHWRQGARRWRQATACRHLRDRGAAPSRAQRPGSRLGPRGHIARRARGRRDLWSVFPARRGAR